MCLIVGMSFKSERQLMLDREVNSSLPRDMVLLVEVGVGVKSSLMGEKCGGNGD